MSVGRRYHNPPDSRHFSGTDPKGLPSYISKNNFALALMDLLVPGYASDEDQSLAKFRSAAVDKDRGLGESELQKVLVDAAATSADRAAFKAAIEAWYESVMERSTGWYKNQIQPIVFGLSFVVAFAANADTIEICKQLYNDDALRAATLQAAQGAAAGPRPQELQTLLNLPEEQVEAKAKELSAKIGSIQGQLKELRLPLGWQADRSVGVAKVLGILLTAIALTMGAPFWFDTLNKFVNVRSALKPPDAAPK